MKKLISIVLTGALVLSLSAVTALADDSGGGGEVAGVLEKTGDYTFEGTLTGDLTLNVSGVADSEDGNYTYFHGTVTGDIEGDLVNGVINSMGLDTVYVEITNVAGFPEDPIRIVGVFLQSGIENDFVGNVVVGPLPAEVTTLTIGSEGDVTEVGIGRTLQMTTTTDPEGDYDVNWGIYVNDRSKATIDQDGVVTGLQTGSVTVIATSEDPSLASDTFQVTVIDPETEVKATADVTYMVVIPSSVDFGTVNRNMDPQTEDFVVSVEDALIEDGASIAVENTTENMTMKDKDGTGSKELAFTLAQDEAPNNGVFTFTMAVLTAEGDDDDASISSQVGCIPENLTAAGSYKGYMTFDVSYSVD